MDTEAMNEKSQVLSCNPNMLAKKAKAEIMETGKTTVVCPKCGNSPVLEKTPRGERTMCYCKCKYVSDVEINFSYF